MAQAIIRALNLPPDIASRVYVTAGSIYVPGYRLHQNSAAMSSWIIRYDEGSVPAPARFSVSLVPRGE